MSAEKIVYQLLTESTDVTDIVSTRIFPVVLPLDYGFSAIVYSLESKTYRHSFSNGSNPVHVTSTVNVMAMAKDYPKLLELVAAISQAVDNKVNFVSDHGLYPTTRQINQSADNYDGDLDLFQRALQYRVTHSESV
ncbi:MAG: hypothetical protein OEY28_03385 [Nitrospira sp.]|nr:hypothetical protein [Nitrospira sp.]